MTTHMVVCINFSYFQIYIYIHVTVDINSLLLVRVVIIVHLPILDFLTCII